VTFPGFPDKWSSCHQPRDSAVKLRQWAHDSLSADDRSHRGPMWQGPIGANEHGVGLWPVWKWFSSIHVRCGRSNLTLTLRHAQQVTNNQWPVTMTTAASSIR